MKMNKVYFIDTYVEHKQYVSFIFVFGLCRKYANMIKNFI